MTMKLGKKIDRDDVVDSDKKMYCFFSFDDFFTIMSGLDAVLYVDDGDDISVYEVTGFEPPEKPIELENGCAYILEDPTGDRTIKFFVDNNFYNYIGQFGHAMGAKHDMRSFKIIKKVQI